MSATMLSLLGFLAWTLLLLVLMEVRRTHLVLTGQVPANGFTPDNAGQSPFMQRLARAHANFLEGLPLFGGIMLVATVAVRARFTAFAVQMGIGVFWVAQLAGASFSMLGDSR